MIVGLLAKMFAGRVLFCSRSIGDHQAQIDDVSGCLLLLLSRGSRYSCTGANLSIEHGEHEIAS